MEDFSTEFQSADWKTEKHVPVIETAAQATRGQVFTVIVSVGKEVAHPNTTAHHIRWIRLYFHPENEKFPVEIGTAEFNAHGESARGADTGTVYTHPRASFTMKTDKPGTLFAASYCNIHGLWKNSMKISVT
jgi:superoxide reductase